LPCCSDEFILQGTAILGLGVFKKKCFKAAICIGGCFEWERVEDLEGIQQRNITKPIAL